MTAARYADMPVGNDRGDRKLSGTAIRTAVAK